MTQAQSASESQRLSAGLSAPTGLSASALGAPSGLRLRAGVKLCCLCCICVYAFACRVFSVLRFESVIHEFDPYFNFRTTKYLQSNGFYDFWNWFDERAWYPLGRVVGQTLFPGLMITANTIWHLAENLGIKLDIREICVFTAPLFAMGTVLATYALTKVCTNNASAGLIAALIIAICPSYLSRSTAGGFDNEAIAIFTLVLSFYTFIRATKIGSVSSVIIASVAYFYMVLAWGGYVFITNTVALYCLAVLAMNRMDMKIFTAYSLWYVLGTIWSLNIPFVGLAAVKSAEHLTSHVAFFVLLLWFLSTQRSEGAFGGRAPSVLLGRVRELVMKLSLSRRAVFASFLLLSAVAGALVYKGAAKFSGRSMTLLDPSYATKNVPIIASISEHQPTTWSVFHAELGPGFVMSPLGIFLALSDSSNPAKWFLGVYATLAGYFSAVMIRLNLVLAPAHAAVVGLAITEVAHRAMNPIKSAIREKRASHNGAIKTEEDDKKVKAESRGQSHLYSKAPSSFTSPFCSLRSSPPIYLGVLVLGFLSLILYRIMAMGTFSAAALYSNPSIVTAATLRNGDRLIIDDLREALQWVNQNSYSGARLMSWWDYGYQAAYMADRGVIVDNNTWNTTHIATVGLALSSDETSAYQIMNHLDVDFVFVMFGGVTRFSGDDLNKFVWINRIASREFPEFCPTENDFMSPYTGRFEVGEFASPILKESLMYRLSYHQFSSNSHTRGVDILRGGGGHVGGGVQTIPPLDPPLRWVEEVYTTTSYLVRVYKVRKSPQRPIIELLENKKFPFLIN